MSVSTIDRYDIGESYEWNYRNAPDAPREVDVPALPGEWTFCNLRVASPLGMPAGPLLNSRWILYYAALGFDVLTYKTVRSRFRASYDPPNLLPVDPRTDLTGEGLELDEAAPGAAVSSWAISYGMPSRDPSEWRPDVERARRGLGAGQLLSVSVVASPEPGWTMTQLADDFAQCAVWAAEAGAHVVEANLSCPNVCTQEADLYLSPAAAAEIASTLRARLPRAVPLALKIGLFPSEEQAAAVLRAVSPFAQSVSSTNSITASVRGRFGGLRRGIGGAATTQRCLAELAMLAGLGTPLKLIGVGGVMSARDVRDRLAAGAEHVHLATAPMIDPFVGIRIRRELAG
jgi:dihydroorotate dehydrogenase